MNESDRCQGASPGRAQQPGGSHLDDFSVLNLTVVGGYLLTLPDAATSETGGGQVFAI